MAFPIAQVGKYTRIVDSSAAITTVACKLLGFYVASTNVGTLIIKDGGTSGTALSGTITPAAGRFHRFPCDINASAYATIGGTALDVTFFYVAGQ